MALRASGAVPLQSHCGTGTAVSSQSATIEILDLENICPRRAAACRLAPGCMEVRIKRGLQELTPWTWILSRKYFLVLMISTSLVVPARHTIWGQRAHMQPQPESDAPLSRLMLGPPHPFHPQLPVQNVCLSIDSMCVCHEAATACWR